MDEKVRGKVERLDDNYECLNIRISDEGWCIIIGSGVDEEVYGKPSGKTLKEVFNSSVIPFLVGYLGEELDDFDTQKFREEYEI